LRKNLPGHRGGWAGVIIGPDLRSPHHQVAKGRRGGDTKRLGVVVWDREVAEGRLWSEIVGGFNYSWGVVKGGLEGISTVEKILGIKSGRGGGGVEEDGTGTRNITS